MVGRLVCGHGSVTTFQAAFAVAEVRDDDRGTLANTFIEVREG